MSAAAPLGILLLEDSPADSRLLVESLREPVSAGTVMIQTVRRLADALRELKRFHFSCVLVDLGLPDGEGVRNVARIREADPNIAIVVLTGLSDARASEEAFRLGAQDYLIKGERLGDELLSFVRRAIEKIGGTRPEAGVAPAPAASGLRYQPWVDVSRGRFGGVHVSLGGDINSLAEVLATVGGSQDAGVDVAKLALSIPLADLPRLASQLAPRVGPAPVHPRRVALRVDAAGPGWEPSAMDEVRALRAGGAEVWLEGWKPGAASLDRVTALALDGIVIAPDVVAELTQPGQDTALRFVRATLALGGALGLAVIADGVALAEQHTRLAMVGCTQMQGQRFAAPVSAEELPGRWRKGPWGLDR